MGAIVTTIQSNMNYGGVAEGSFGPDITPVSDLPSFSGGIEIPAAPEDALMSVSISGDTDHFFIRDVYVMEWTEEIWRGGDDGEGPPPHAGSFNATVSLMPKVRVLEVVNFSDGTTPLEVKKDQYVLIRTSYAAGFEGGTFNATVTIQGDTWETVSIPLSLFIADVKTTPSTILNIAQGQKALLPFIIQSLAGPVVDVHFEMSPTQLDTGLTLTSNNFTLQAGESQNVLLEFTADTNAPIGTEEVALDQYAFRRKGFFFTANIIHAQVTVNPLIPHTIFVERRGSKVNIPVSIQLNNGPAVDITFTPHNLPDDVSLQNNFFSGDADTVLNMEMSVGYALNDEFSFFISWESQWGQTGSMNFIVVITEAEVITLNTPVTTPEGFPLGGWTEMSLYSNGNYVFKGSMEASGFTSYNYGLQVFIKAANGIILTAFHSGNVYGTDTPGKRDDPWEEVLNSDAIKYYWLSIRNNPLIEYQLNADISGVTGTVWDITKAGLEVIVGFISGGVVGAAIVLGSELASAAGITPPPGVLEGIAVVNGTIAIFGPGAIIPAIVAGAITGVAIELLIQARPIRDDEKDFARLVFGKTLDDKFNENKVWITNLSYDGGRKYTIPNLHGTILLNLDTACDDPVHYADPKSGSDYSQPGAVFIHELTHACQIATNKFMPGLICTGPGTYTYHAGNGEAARNIDKQWVNQQWTDFTREQQAHIVDDWYGANCFKIILTKDGDFWREQTQFFTDLNDLNENLNSDVALKDPAFHFITQCRAGIF